MREYLTASSSVPTSNSMHKIIGVNERWYPCQNGMCGATLVVLVEGQIGDYAAYAGHGSKEWVADHGDKVSFEEACIHFPGGQLRKELYRD